MDIVHIFLITSGVIILILIVINIILFWYSYKTNKMVNKLLENGKIEEFKDIFLLQKERNDSLEEEIKKAILRVKSLEDISEITIRKIGIVRYNPFNNMGGNQSFCIAMLDNKNNGFLISSLFIGEGSRVYTKTVKNGKSEYTLSREEVEAIEQAIKS